MIKLRFVDPKPPKGNKPKEIGPTGYLTLAMKAKLVQERRTAFLKNLAEGIGA